VTPPIPIPAPSGTGTLTVFLADIEGRPLVDASVTILTLPPRVVWIGSARTGTNGSVSFSAVPATVQMYANHEAGESYQRQDIAVAQEGATFLNVTMQPGRGQPTAALLPVSIPAGSVSADRSELSLQVTVVASAAATFVPAYYGDYTPESTPAISLAIEEPTSPYYGERQCRVWLDRKLTVPTCGGPWGESPYTVSVLEFEYDRAGSVPVLASPASVQSAMLVIDQSARVASLDPNAQRSFALRQFVSRNAARSVPRSLSPAGLAGDGGQPPAVLPSRPLWWPFVAGTYFSSDPAILTAAIAILEPLTGGTAPVFDALDLALATTTDEAPPGNRALVVMLGGGDDSGLSTEEREQALAALGQQRDATGILSLLIAGASLAQPDERTALAELAATLRAPTIALGIFTDQSGNPVQSWTAGSFGALDLAADLLDGLPLPTLSATFRVTADAPDTFLSGAILHGVIYLESYICDWDCYELPIEFAVRIP
jgi:hypothetical protein